MPNVFEAKAPCRVDLSGGTLDLWPIYLNFPQGLVLNHVAIRLYATAKVTLEPSSSFKLRIVSKDYKKSRTFRTLEALEKSLSENVKDNPLRWLCRVSHYFLQNSGWDRGSFTLETESEVPPGSGLGGSSTLGIAMGAAWAKALDKRDLFKKDPWLLQSLMRDLESIEIEHPAGEQDYVPAMFGGLMTFHKGPALSEVRRFPYRFAKELMRHMALIYTGKPHHSGINNWAVYKDYIDGKASVKKAFDEIDRVSHELVHQMLRADFHAVGALINEEWKWRQKLGLKVNAPVLKKAQEWAQKQGATAAKACGAGGGGCLLVYFDEAEKRREFLEMKTLDKDWTIYPVICAKGGVIDEL